MTRWVPARKRVTSEWKQESSRHGWQISATNDACLVIQREGCGLCNGFGFAWSRLLCYIGELCFRPACRCSTVNRWGVV